MCKECEMLRVQIVALRDTIKRQRQMIQDLGGVALNDEEDPYEDEAPLVVWEPKDE